MGKATGEFIYGLFLHNFALDYIQSLPNRESIFRLMFLDII